MRLHAVRMLRTPIRSALLLTVATALTASLTTACTSSAGTRASSSAGRSGASSSGVGTSSSGAPAPSPTTGATPSRSATTSATPVPPPSPGNINETVPSRTVQTRPAVPVSSPASFGNKVTVQATSIRAINATAHGPGEIGGPAVAITLRFTNSTSRAIDLGNAVVTVLDSAKDPASTIAGSPADPVTGSLAAHRSTTGTYVFTISTSRRKPITINVSYAPSAPVVLLIGNVG